MKIPKELSSRLAMLEGPIDRLAVEMLCEHGALNFVGEIGETIGKLDPKSENFVEFTRLLKTLSLNHAQHEELWTAVWSGVGDRQELAYLLGIAVGRRLGSQPLLKGGTR
jgi:hypothetical protein